MCSGFDCTLGTRVLKPQCGYSVLLALHLLFIRYEQGYSSPIKLTPFIMSFSLWGTPSEDHFVISQLLNGPIRDPHSYSQ